MKPRYEHSFGIIPLQKRRSQWWALVICQRGCWGFPKGHPNDGESSRQTAERELFEETGLSVTSYPLGTPFEEIYTFQRGDVSVFKRVHYFPALATGALVLQIAEVENGKWLPLDRVQDALKYGSTRQIWKRVAQQLIDL